jgi:HK97 family phage major capsid protein
MKLKVKQFEGDTGGEYIVQPMTPSMLKDWMGYDYKTSTTIPTNLTYGNGTDITELYFANWQEVILAMWGGVQIMATKEAGDAFQKNQTWIRIIQDVDIAIRHPQSFCIVPDARKRNQ